MYDILFVLKLALVFVYAWFTSFLWHELGHIKCEHLSDTGDIQVFDLSMQAYRNNATNDAWFYYAGGILSGLLHIIIGLLCTDLVFKFGFLTVGFVNLAYGFFEGHFLPKWGDTRRYKIGRYAVYLSIVVIALIIWWVIR